MYVYMCIYLFNKHAYVAMHVFMYFSINSTAHINFTLACGKLVYFYKLLACNCHTFKIYTYFTML